MQLNEQGLKSEKEWESKGYKLPQFDHKKVQEQTKENPFWIHFGAGNIFRAFQANIVQNLLNQGVLDRGLIVAEGFDYEIIQKMNQPHDEYSILVTLKSNGSIEKTIVGSVMESLSVDPQNKKDFERLKEIFAKDSLQIASFTITEKGYNLQNGKGELLEDVKEDMQNGPAQTKSYIGKIAALLYARFSAGEKPIAMVSMDNCSHNGDKLYEAVSVFAETWSENALTEEKFKEYVKDRKKVTFPWSMIDKITPRPDNSIETILKNDGVEELEPVITSKKTYIAPFVNAEECEYMVIEDAFPNGRPELEKAGVIFTNQQTVDKVEKMKVCTCLNPIHTALAIFGCLLGYKKISEEMQDKELKRLVERIGYVEGLPVVSDPVVLDPKEFIDTVLNVRIPNPFMPDTPQRIATDTSQKIAIRFGTTIKAYNDSRTLSVKQLQAIPIVLAGWIRYLMGIDDFGNTFELSPDPLMDTLKPSISHLRLGGKINKQYLEPILSNESIFGVNLREMQMRDMVIRYLEEMIEGPGAVRKTLKKYTK